MNNDTQSDPSELAIALKARADGKYTMAWEHLFIAAEKGSPEAMYHVGDAYRLGGEWLKI